MAFLLAGKFVLLRNSVIDHFAACYFHFIVHPSMNIDTDGITHSRLDIGSREDPACSSAYFCLHKSDRVFQA
jgi:hypothetical protein